MKIKYLLIHLLTLVFSVFVSVSLKGQDTEKILLISKISKSKKVRQISNDTRLKIQTQSGDFIRTRLHSAGNDYLLTQEKDTIFFNDIYSFRAQRKLNKTEFFVGVPLLITGIVTAVAGVPLSIMLIYMAEAGSGIFFVPLAGVAATITGIKIVGRKTYRTDRWRIFSVENR